MEFKIAVHRVGFSKEKYTKYALVSDIGGTTTPLALYGQKQDGKIEQIFTITFKSKDVKNFENCVNESLKFAFNEYGVKADEIKAAFGVAGPIENNRRYSKPTNLPWDVNADGIAQNTYLKEIVLLNDFEIIGYGIDMLDKKDTISLNYAQPIKGTAAVIGAGTGLGMSILHFDQRKNLHFPLASEGGHMNFPSKDEDDFRLANFIKKEKKFKEIPGYEQFVSGQGIENIYRYFSTNVYKKRNPHVEIAADKAAEISKRYNSCDICKDTINSFLKYYGRAASDLALTAMATDGVYVAGGIAPKIIERLRNGIFIEEFYKNYRHFELLKKIPVFVVLNPQVGLLGAANAALNFFDDLKN